MKKCLIVSGGEYSPMENTNGFEYIIACDRGYENCLKLGIKPDLVIGDFDSYAGEVTGGARIRRLNPIKDDTDTISAVKDAFANGYKDITICCAFGGRFDHSFANVQTAAFILEKGGIPSVFGKGTAVYGIKDGGINISRKENSYLSVFALSDVCRGVSISGAKYEIDDAELTNTFPLGVSNEWAGDAAHISVEKGTLIVIISENIKVD